MLTFFNDCMGLFNDTFTAAASVDYFKFLMAYIILMVGYVLFSLMSRARKL